MTSNSVRYSPEIAAAICEKITSGTSVGDIGLTEGFPNKVTIYRWIEKYPEFREKFSRAMDLRDDEAFARLRELQTEEPRKNERGVDAAWVNWRRLQIDTLKWELSKRQPRKYGDKVQQEVSGPEGGPIQANVMIEFVQTKNTNAGQS